MTQASPLFGQTLGLAHQAGSRALHAVLEPQGVTFPQWVTVKAVHDEGGPLPREVLTTRMATALRIDPVPTIDGLAAQGALESTPDGLILTEAGRMLFARLASLIGDLSAQLLDGLPADDLAATHRVLTTFTERANGVAS